MANKHYKVINICEHCGGLCELRVYKKDVRCYCKSCNLCIYVVGGNKYKKLTNLKEKEDKIIEKYSIEELRTMDYERYLKTGHWKRIRKNYYKKHNKICWCCNDESKVLHHINYSNRGNEKDEDLITLCEDCHNGIHNMMKENKTIKLIDAHKLFIKGYRKT